VGESFAFQSDFISLFFAYALIVFVILILYDFALLLVSTEISLRLSRIAVRLITKQGSGRYRRGMVVHVVRLKYGFDKMMYQIRLHWVGYGGWDSSPVYTHMVKRPIRNIIFGLVLYLFRPFSLLCLSGIALMAIIQTESQRFLYADLSQLYSAIQGIDYWNVAARISSIVPAIFLVGIFYLISTRGTIRRAIENLNLKSTEDIARKHRELSKSIGNAIYPIANNLQYVVDCQHLVVDAWMVHMFPENRHMIEHSVSAIDYDHYCFMELIELLRIHEAFESLSGYPDHHLRNVFSTYKYEILHLVSRLDHYTIDRLNKIFFSKDSIIELLQDTRSGAGLLSQEDFRREQLDRQHLVAEETVKALELLCAFVRYHDTVSRLMRIDSDRFGRALRIAIQQSSA